MIISKQEQKQQHQQQNNPLSLWMSRSAAAKNKSGQYSCNDGSNRHLCHRTYRSILFVRWRSCAAPSTLYAVPWGLGPWSLYAKRHLDRMERRFTI